MKNRRKWLLLTTLIAAVGLASACGSGKENKEEESAEENLNEEDLSSEESNEAGSLEDTIEKNSLGDFSTVDIYGNTVTPEIFADYDLTLVNLFATWCGPCISEMPELAQIQKDMRDDGVNVVAVVLDSAYAGQIDTEVVSTAQLIAEYAEAEFTFIVPDATNMNGRLDGISAVPESFFVDSEGNIVGETYVGARDYDTWKEIIELELSYLQ